MGSGAPRPKYFGEFDFLFRDYDYLPSGSGPLSGLPYSSLNPQADALGNYIFEYSKNGGKDDAVYLQVLEDATSIADLPTKAQLLKDIARYYVSGSGKSDAVITQIIEKAWAISDQDWKYMALTAVMLEFHKNKLAPDQAIQNELHKLIAPDLNVDLGRN
jgi:hypothetical protein